MRWIVPERKLDESQLSVLQALGGLEGGHEWVQGVDGTSERIIMVHFVKWVLARKPEADICVVVLTHTHRDLIAKQFDGEEHGVPVMTYGQFFADQERYDLVIAVDIEDISAAELKNLKRLTRRVVIFGNDQDQGLYPNGVTAEEIEALLAPRPHLLNVTHRLTKNLHSAREQRRFRISASA